MSLQRRPQLHLLIGLAVLLSLSIVKSPQAAPYYQGKIITVVVGSAPGGGYDRMARLFFKYIPKYIPGKPAIIINNMPGASSMIAANYLYNIAKPDGLTMGTFNQGLPFAQLLKSEGARFNMTKYSWIGSTAVEASILAIRNDLPYKTFDDLRKATKPVHFTSAGPGTMGHQIVVLLKEFVGLNANIVIYPSTADQMLGIERKEADGLASTVNSLMPFMERGMVRPVLRGRVAVPGIEQLPVDEDLTTDKKGKVIMAIRSATDLVGRPYVAPPATPGHIMAILREAFAKTSKDADLQAEAKRIKMAVQYVPHDECLKVYNYIFNQQPDIIKEFSKYIKFG